MGMESCLTGILVRQSEKLAKLRGQARAAGHQEVVTPTERKMYQKQRAALKKQDADLVEKISRDKQRIRTGGGNCLSNPHKALARHQEKLNLHRQRTAATIKSFPHGV